MNQSTLIGIALLGTARQTKLPAPFHKSLNDIWDILAERDITSAVLQAAAIEKTANQAGFKVIPGIETPSPCELEEHSYAPLPVIAAASRMLKGDYTACLTEWLIIVRNSDLLASPRLLPGLLDHATRHQGIRQQIIPVLGKRGVWLARQNTDWAWLLEHAESSQSYPEDWEVASAEERIAQLRALRLTNTEAAAKLIFDHWKSESADTRESIAALVALSPSASDIQWLEDLALKDRRSATRSFAAKALIQLPESSYYSRSISRASSLLSIKSRKLTLSPPDSFHPDWAADGIQEKPPQHTGEKAWWSRQIIARIPLSLWPDILGIKDPFSQKVHPDWLSCILSAWIDSACTYDAPEHLPCLVKTIVSSKLHEKDFYTLKQKLPLLLTKISIESLNALTSKVEPSVLLSSLIKSQASIDFTQQKALAKLLLSALEDSSLLNRAEATALASCPAPSSIPNILKKISKLKSLTAVAEEFARTLEFRQSYLAHLTAH